MENYSDVPPGGSGDSGSAREQLSTPAILLMVTGGLGIAMGLLGLLQGAIMRGKGMYDQLFSDPNLQQYAPMMRTLQSTNWISNVLVLVLGAVTIVGALKMKNLENYSLSMAAAIIAMVPCVGPCCCIGLPVGIWALILLNKPEIKSAFRN